MKKAAIILPTYNEVENVKKIIPQIFSVSEKVLNWEFNIVVVDSHSEDGTEEEILRLIKKYPRLHLIRTKKEGLGKAYIEGFRIAIEKLNPYLLFEMDADLSHNPENIPQFLKKIEQGADFVIGSRYMKDGSIPKNWGIHRKFLSVVGNLTIKLGFMKPQIHDWTSGYRAIKSWIVKEAFEHLKNYSGYVFQVALLDFALKKRARISETPINFKDRTSGISKINAPQFVINALLYVFFHSSFVKFVIVGIIGFGIDFGISYLGIEKLHQPVWLSTVVSTETAIASNFLLNNFWSFAHKKVEHHAKSYLWNFLKFNLVSSGSILIQTLGIQLLVIFVGKEWWYLYKVIIILFVIIPYSYILYNKVVWKERK